MTMLSFRRTGNVSDCPLVLLHALPLDATMWDRVRELLAPIDVITVDAPGFGESPAGSEIAEDPSVAAYVQALKETLDHHGVQQILLGGLSMGGSVAAEFVATYPEMIRGLALMDTGIGADNQDRQAFRRDMAQRAEEGRAFEILEDWKDSMTGSEVTPEIQESLVARFKAAPGEGLAWIQRALATREDRSDAVELVEGPVFFIRGTDDPTASLEYFMNLALKAKEPRILEIEGAGHFTADEKPEELAQALSEFVQRCAR
ncbi:alpha/beta hydrolase [Arcanobacterium haemolyticum]|uniref:Alpha/beta hydrolase fold protein n=1 Tax=Arcanobacterium haemolyticum (strain ATCC 9345 / DSM 20595 / CCM 5947 / CCUG 17215 / LMG 16163 / NBRC 15585 / NCTC 8452 / 11018) TaxID=644284 RepID=D7BMH8_ARCHD|nr:alpha/beta hydrolase [Arcanobacterium haemolyticum]ADH92127.1 alpha/beta hydrolase fold protein [Arcanobacterium haemolyticum DSM 20595]QCX46289.1 alpha/beta hydrolase [Arcanobacterium haemolyticum]SQH29168.1 Lipase 1 precursor [Arcanobacterium haemolyticum]